MKTPEDAKEWALRRIKHFTEELEKASDHFEIETKIYTIMQTAKTAYEDAHRMNAIAKGQI